VKARSSRCCHLSFSRLSKAHVPRALEFFYVAGMTLQFGSESTKLFDVFDYWDKVVHPTLIALTPMIAGWILLGSREAFGPRIPTHFAAVFEWLVECPATLDRFGVILREERPKDPQFRPEQVNTFWTVH
jgi:hypothetical protein